MTTAAEVAGFAVPAAVGAWSAGSQAPGAVVFTALVVAGAIEGALLGAGQALVLRAALPAIPSRAWIGATALGAAASYAIALVPSTVGAGLERLAWPVVAAGATLLGVAFLLALAGLQWRVLRGRVARAGRWIAITAGAWVAGLTVFAAIASPLWHEGQAVWLVVAIGILAGAAMALTVAAVTGAGLVRLLDDASGSGDAAPAHRRSVA